MKQIALLFVILSFISCTKEKEQSIVGTWTVTKVNAGTGYGFNTSIFQPGSEFSIQFNGDGSFVLFGPNADHSVLHHLNRYRMISGNKVHFYNNSNLQEQLDANIEINNGLLLSYVVRCGYEEQFVRH